MKETVLTTPQFYRVSDSVFIGTISSIDYYANGQWKIQFNAEKIWKGENNSMITLLTNSLQECGYSLVKDEKYLVFASGSPSYLIPQTTQPYADAQYAISLYDDPQFQAEELAKENLNKKLEAAKDIITNMMVNHNTSNIPFNMVGVDVLNATLEVGIDSTKATLSKDEYQKKIKDIVGDIPIHIEIGVINTTGDVSTNNISGNDSLPSLQFSPLKQFKSGTPALDVKCNDGLKLILKAEDASPACVKPDTAQILTERGWAWNYAIVVGKESITLSAYQGISYEVFYNNGTVASNFTINVNINNFRPSNALLVLQVYYNDGILYKTVSVPSGMIQPDGFYKYQLIAVSDKNHPVPYKVVATYNNETAITYAPVFAHP